MFDGNRDIIAGRDINIQSNHDLSMLATEELTLKVRDCFKIKGQENKKKFRRTLSFLTFIAFLFVVIYFSLPFFLNYLTKNTTGFLQKMIPKEIDATLKFNFMISLTLLAILKPVSDIWATSSVERKQDEMIDEIRVILKEREYLNKKQEG